MSARSAFRPATVLMSVFGLAMAALPAAAQQVDSATDRYRAERSVQNLNRSMTEQMGTRQQIQQNQFQYNNLQMQMQQQEQRTAPGVTRPCAGGGC